MPLGGDFRSFFLKYFLILITTSLFFTACDSQSTDKAVDTNVADANSTIVVKSTPEVLLGADTNLSVSEGGSNSYDVSKYIENADSFCFIDIDEMIETVVSDDCKSFTSPDLNISLVDGNLTVVGNVDVTTFFSFGIRGSDDSNNSVDMNMTLEVIDEVDDQPIVLDGFSVSDVVVLGNVPSIAFNVSDVDGMESVRVTVTGSVEDSYDVYPDDNLSCIDVNVSFPDLAVGDYNISFMAQGVVGGEGARSTLEGSYPLTILPLDSTPDQFNFTNNSYLALNTRVSSSVIRLTGINTEVTATTTEGSLVVNNVNTNVSSVKVENGDSISIILRSSSSYATSIDVVVTIGGVSDEFSVTTQNQPAPPPPPTLTPAEQCVASGGLWTGTGCI